MGTIQALIFWVALVTDMAAFDKSQVRIVVAPPEVICSIYYNRECEPDDAIPYAVTVDNVMFFRAGWDPSTLAGRAVLVHELVHAMQYWNDVPMDGCKGDIEKTAYDVMFEYLRSRGIENPEAAMGVSPMFYKFVTASCEQDGLT